MALGHWLKDYIGPKGSGGGGYSISKQVVFDEPVTTRAAGEGLAAYSQFIPSAPIVGTIEVEFNGTIYTMEGVGDGCKRYGAPYDENTEAYDWSQYPFSMYVCPDSEQVNLNTETAGTYTLKITSDAATVTDEFRMAVRAAMGSSGGGDEN